MNNHIFEGEEEEEGEEVRCRLDEEGVEQSSIDAALLERQYFSIKPFLRMEKMGISWVIFQRSYKLTKSIRGPNLG